MAGEKYLTACSGISATRQGVAVNFAVDRERTQMLRDDEVTIADPEPSSCTTLLQGIAGKPGDYRDYAMVAHIAPDDPHLPRLARYFQNGYWGQVYTIH